VIPKDCRRLADPFLHLSRMNVCFADGHVKPCGPSEVVMGSPLWEVYR
jgi:prepilin-type processing-associated H-X9-DG protein